MADAAKLIKQAVLNLLLSDGHTIVASTLGNSLFTLQDDGLATGGVLVASENR